LEEGMKDLMNDMNSMAETLHNADLEPQASDGKVYDDEDEFEDLDQEELEIPTRHVEIHNHIGNIYGSVNAGQTSGFLNQTAGISLPSYVMDQASLEWISNIYVEKPHYNSTKAQLLEHQILFLYGDSGNGKFTSALYLLQECSCDDYIQLFPDTDLHHLDKAWMKENTGYLIDGLLDNSLEGVPNAAFHEIQKMLKEKGSYLIITIHAPKRPSFSWNPQLLVHCELPIDKNKILQNHIAQVDIAPEHFSILMEYTNRSDFREFVDTHMLPVETEQFVGRLISFVKGTVEEKDIYDGIKSNAYKGIMLWFKENPSPKEVCLLVALAVFNGLSFDYISNAAIKLQKLLGLVENSQDVEANGVSFFESKTELLKRVRAHSTIRLNSSELGSVSVSCAVLDNSSDSESVLLYLWNEHVQIKRPLLDWLSNIIVQPESGLASESALFTLGILCKFDFKLIKDSIIQPWALDANPRIRVHAVKLLYVLFRDKQLAPQVSRLLNHWSSLSNNYKLSWTSIATFSKIGPYAPEIVFQQIDKIMNRRDLKEGVLLETAVSRIFSHSQLHPYLSLKVMDWLVSRCELPNEDLTRPLSIFLKLVHASHTEKQIFQLIKNKQMREKYWARLMLWTLKDKGLKASGYQMLKHILIRCHEHNAYSAAEKMTLGFVLDMSIQQRQNLSFELKRWANSKHEPVEAASKILRKLQQFMA
jgi:hypothetical protein